MKKSVELNFREHKNVLAYTFSKLEKNIINASDLICRALIKKNLILWCGNGGSASDSMHLSAEFIGRFNKKRKSLNSISLASNSSALTCISNDFGYKNVFSRQIEGLGKKNDVLIIFSTSGNSENILMALKKAKKYKMRTIAFLGKGGGRCKGLSDIDLIVPSQSTARIQEMHILIGHTLCDLFEKKLKLTK